MKRFGIISLLGLLLAISLSLALSAPPPQEVLPGTYQVDPVHSSVWFRIKHLNVAYLYGRFNEVTGTVILDPEDLAASRVDIQVKAESIDTHNADRDKHLKSPEFFDVEKYPLITFRSQACRKIGDNEYEVQGDLTLHGVTRPLTVTVVHTGAGPGMQGEYRVGFETTFTIKRSDFGMTTLIGPVADEVRITVSGEGIRQ